MASDRPEGRRSRRKATWRERADPQAGNPVTSYAASRGNAGCRSRSESLAGIGAEATTRGFEVAGDVSG